MSLSERTALVTGGSRGIGRAIAVRLGAMGATVYVNYVAGAAAAEETLRLIKEQGGRGEIIGFDVSDPDKSQAAIKEIASQAGSLDILVNNAGITRDGLVVRMKESDWDQVMDTNLKGAFFCAKAASRLMMKKRWGRIINITSVIGFAGNAGQANYASAKAGMVGLTKSLAREFASRNILVNGVAPGYIVTDMTADLSEDIQETIKSEIPMAELGSPEDVAAAVAFLASEDSRYMTGQVLHVNGGMYM
ncbi:MAG: 3-oxoacyl-[acyl-carrier-protein] reductase [Thermodesulfobacteriota bacterium]